MAGVVLTQTALAAEVGEWGRVFVSMALLLFVFTTLVYNYYLGENALSFFSTKRPLLIAYRALVMALVLWGSMQDLSTVFGFADVTMGLLALVNLVALALLYKVGKRLMHDYDDQVKAGIENPVFDARKFADLDLDHRAWSTDKATDANGADTAAGLAHSHR
ncbi:Amino-acid carrier protein AlsT [compost metagenome]